MEELQTSFVQVQISPTTTLLLPREHNLQTATPAARGATSVSGRKLHSKASLIPRHLLQPLASNEDKPKEC